MTNHALRERKQRRRVTLHLIQIISNMNDENKSISNISSAFQLSNCLVYSRLRKIHVAKNEGNELSSIIKEKAKSLGAECLL